VGTVHPQKVLTNAKARPGDALILTKPLGLGIITTAAKQGEDRLEAISEAIGVMKTLNRTASEVMVAAGAHALTDVTGFGLLGHLRNITAASQVGANVWLSQVPVLPAAREYVLAGIAPGGTHANWRFLNSWVDYATSLTKEEQLVLCDAQTSGGLLAALSQSDADQVLASLREAGLTQAAMVGVVTADASGRIAVSSRA